MSRDHYGYGLRLFAFIGQGFGDKRGGAEECAVRQTGDESRNDEHGSVGGECGEQVTRQGDNHEHNNEILWWHFAAEHQNQCAETHADGIRGNIVAGGRDVYAGGGCGLRQNAHHHELGGAENECA